MTPAKAYAEQTEQDAAESLAMMLEAPTDETIPEQSSLLTEAAETAEMTPSQPDSGTGEIQDGTLPDSGNQEETAPETGLPEELFGNETRPSETTVESDTESPKNPVESETGQKQSPETVPAQPETQNSPGTTKGESETSQGITEPSQAESQTETQPETGQISEAASTEEQTEGLFPEYDETETEIIGIDTSMYGTDTYEDESGGYGSYGGSTWWDPSWYITSKYRFRQVDKVILTSGGEAVDVMEEPKTNADRVGRIPQFSVAYLLQEEKNGWLYIESPGRSGDLLKLEK